MFHVIALVGDRTIPLEPMNFEGFEYLVFRTLNYSRFINIVYTQYPVAFFSFCVHKTGHGSHQRTEVKPARWRRRETSDVFVNFFLVVIQVFRADLSVKLAFP